MIYGKWTECLWGIDPAAYESFKKRERRGDHLSKPQPVRCCPRGGGGARGGEGFRVECGGSLPSLCWACGVPAGEDEGLESARPSVCCSGPRFTCISVCRGCCRQPGSGATWYAMSPKPGRAQVHLRFFLGTPCSGFFFVNLLSPSTSLA